MIERKEENENSSVVLNGYFLAIDCWENYFF